MRKSIEFIYLNRLENILFKILLITSFIIYHVNSLKVLVQNEDELIESLNTISTDSLIIDIGNTEIELSEDLIINNNKKSITINGLSRELSILNFKNITNGFFFENTVKEVNFFNLTINGYLKFKHNQVIFENADINGSLDLLSEGEEVPNNESFKMNNVNFNAISNDDLYQNNDLYCIRLNGNVIISNSKFTGNSFCKRNIIFYTGQNINSLTITHSYFDGDYSTAIIKIEYSKKAAISFSTFTRGASIYKEGGGAIRVRESYISINDCSFNDNYSFENGGSIDIYDTYKTNIYNINVYNSTSKGAGGFLYIYSSSYYESKVNMYNIRQRGVGNNGKVYSTIGGLVTSVEGYSSLYMENFYGEDLVSNTGIGLFTLDQSASIELKNVEIHRVSSSRLGGLLLHTYNELKGSRFKMTNATLTDFYQYHERLSSTFIWITKYVNVSLNNCYLYGFTGRNSVLIYHSSPSYIEINNFVLDGYYNTIPNYLIYGQSYSETEKVSLTLNNVNLTTIYNSKAILKYDTGDINIFSSSFKDIYNCDEDDICDSSIVILENSVTMNIENSNFENIYTKRGFRTNLYAKVTIENSNIVNNEFNKGFIEIDSDDYLYGIFTIKKSNFKYNRGYNGVILNIIKLDLNSEIVYYDCVFDGNIAKKYGGVVYSNSLYSDANIFFNNCIFNENKAYLGNISYSLEKKHEPYFTNVDDLRKVKGSFVTNPTKIKLLNSVSTYSIISGEKLQDNIDCKLYDDYDNVCEIKSDLSTLKIDEFIFYDVEINDTYNAVIYDHSLSYCRDNVCSFPPIKIIGNPGNYKLKLKLNSYGPFYEFENNSIEINLKIEECDVANGYIFQNVHSEINLKSCYKPKCDLSCNQGTCVNINVCDCTATKLYGLQCNEHYKLRRSKLLTVFFLLLSFILTISIIVILFLTLTYKDNMIFKLANIRLLVIIIVGLIFNSSYIISLTFEKSSKFHCIVLYLYKNMGFSLVFGSIIAKAYSLYTIFIGRKLRAVRRKRIYSIVLVISIFHLFIITFWIINDEVDLVLAYTNDLKQYKKCLYPISRRISILFNMMILCIGCILSYLTRHVKNNYKEKITVPIYTYVVLMILMGITDLDYDFPIIVQDLLNVLGTFINTSVILYYIYIVKLYSIYIKKKMRKRRSAVEKIKHMKRPPVFVMDY